MSPRMRFYLAAVGLAAVLLLAFNLPPDPRVHGLDYALWAAIAVLSETMWLPTISGNGTWSMSSTAGLATVVLWGAGPAIWIGALSTLAAELVVQKKPWIRATFNASQIAVTMWAASGAFALLGGPAPGLQSLTAIAPTGARLAVHLAVPVLGVFVAYYLVNRSLVAVAVAWSTQRRWWRVMREDWLFAERLIEDAAAFLLSPLMVISFRAIGYVGVLLFYAPLRMIFESEKRYVELRKAQSQMVHTERMAAKGEMAAEVGHELRNQLAAISGRAQMLLKDVERGAPENLAKHAQIILEQSRRMESLSRGLMDFSRAELSIERVDVNGLVQKTVEFVRGQNRFDAVEWDLRLSERVPELRADPGQVQQVLLNLFMNAADAMKEKALGPRVIGVTTDVDDRFRELRLVVTDTGTGIPASNLARIFEPHFTTKAEGHGFGLSTSYRIITNHGGRIAAESPPGHGASFTVTLPVNGPGGWS